MSKNTVLAFLLSLIIVIIWMIFVQRNYNFEVDKNPPIFNGIKKITFNENSGLLRIEWDKAKDESEVQYLIFASESNKITNLNSPLYSTKENFIEINELDFNLPYYFLVVAVDAYNNWSTNRALTKFTPKKILNGTENIVKLETEVAEYYFSSSGGRIKQIILKNYKNIDDRKNVNLIFYPEKIYSKYYPLDFLILKEPSENFRQNDLNLYEISSKTEKSIEFKRKSDDFEITKKYIFDNSSEYHFRLKILLKYKNSLSKINEYNKSEVVLKLQPFLGPLDEKSRYNILNIGYFSKNKLELINFSKGGGCLRTKEDLGKIVSIKKEGIEYLTFHNRYFIGAIIPVERVRVERTLFYSDGKFYVAGLCSKFNPEFFKKGEIEYNYILYFGPKLRDTFRKYNQLSNLEKAIGFRKIISPIGNLFLDLLRFFYKIVKSWGVSIILFTILIKIILYPFTHRQFVSMAKMQKIQPIILQVRQQYSKDPQKLNQEIMKIYKKYKVNPLGGCLPIIFQIPIFLAIWDMLQYSLELRDAPFLWIKSFALPDTIGYLAGIPLNPLPAIMGITMFIQQKMSTTDPQYKLTAMLMPFIFLILFWNMPSGLVLYWTVQNILNIIEQIYLKTKINKIELLEVRKNESNRENR